MPPRTQAKRSAKTTVVSTTKPTEISEDALCDICYDNEFKYKCPSCGVKACYKCIERYISDFANLAPHCVQCQTLLPFDVIYSALGSKGIKTFHAKSGMLRFELECQLIPDCLECCRICQTVEKYNENGDFNIPECAYILADILGLLEALRRQTTPGRRSETITNAQVDTTINYIVATFDNAMSNVRDIEGLIHVRHLLNGIAMKPSYITPTQVDKIINVVYQLSDKKLHVNLRELLEILAYKGRSQDYIIYRFSIKNEDKKLGSADAVKYVFRCSKDDCKGFVDTNYICQLCRQRYCSICFKPINENEAHECDANDVATAEELKEHTKPCPNCAAPVFKVSGCSQMFCVNCRIGFDWNTGRIIKGDFHNPDRLDWIRKHGNITINHECNARRNRIPQAFESMFIHISELLFRSYQHNHISSMIRANNKKLKSFEDDEFRWRCHYVLNIVTRDEYIEWCTRWEFTRHKVEMITGIYTEFVETARDLLLSCYESRVSLEKELKDITHNRDIGFLVELMDIEYHNGELSPLMVMFRDIKEDDEKYEWIERIIRSHINVDDYCVLGTGCITMLPDILDNRVMCNMVFDVLKQKYRTFEDELSVFNELTNHINEQLTMYKKMFSIPRITRPVNIGDPRQAKPSTYTVVA